MEHNGAVIAFVDHLKSCDGLNDAWSVFDTEVKQFGIENALYCFSEGRSSQITNEQTFFHSHDNAFIEAYDQGGYMDCDWSILHCQNGVEPALWTSPDLFSRLTPFQIEGEYLARDFNLVNGLTLPIRGGTALGWGGVGLSATGMKTDEWYRLLNSHQGHLEALAQAFHEFVMSRGFFNVFSLSPKEQEVLKWMVHGLDKHEIADKLNISVRTSEVHMYRIRRKLNCANDVQVAVKALTLNLLDSE